MTPDKQPTPTPFEAAIVIAICFGQFILTSLISVAKAADNGAIAFNDASMLSLIVTECFFGAIALAYLRHRGYSLPQLLPVPDLRGCLMGLALYIGVLMVWTIGPGALFSAQQGNQPIDKIMAHSFPSLTILIMAGMVNGLYEETFLIGYLVRGFLKNGASFAVGLSCLVRMMYHLYQGPIGATFALFFGIIMSLFYWRTRLLWPIVFAHTLGDIVPFALRH